MAGGSVCRSWDRWRHKGLATLVDVRGSNLSDASSILAISTINANNRYNGGCLRFDTMDGQKKGN
jgi:hypothetical protein